ncbi:MAG: magnesium transporter, partial [Gammaproteobacteria bacterium]|nr:magnesium transporter [Gammaproteobacteria bacterium]
MSEVEERKPQERLQERFSQVLELLQRHRLIEESVARQGSDHQERVDQLVQRQHYAELQQKLDELHPADIAYILEALPLEDRLAVWQLVRAESDGDILLEVSDSVRETLIADMDTQEIIAATKDLDADELADLAPELPRDVVQGLMES